MQNGALAGLALLAAGVALYFLPAIVAGMRGHRQALAIFMLNLLLGWTVLGWAVAMVWSCMAHPEPVAISALGFREPPDRTDGVVAYEPTRRARDAPSPAVQRVGAVMTGLLLLAGMALAAIVRGW